MGQKKTKDESLSRIKELANNESTKTIQRMCLNYNNNQKYKKLKLQSFTVKNIISVQNIQKNRFIPYEILFQIFIFQRPDDLMKHKFVCRFWNEILSANQFWRENYQNLFIESRIYNEEVKKKKEDQNFYRALIQDYFFHYESFKRKKIFFFSHLKNQVVPVRMCILGLSNSGKTSIAKRFTKNEFDNNEISTPFASFLTFFSITPAIKFDIFDTGGKNDSLAPMYFRDSVIVLIVYCVDCCESLKKAKFWYKNVVKYNKTIKSRCPIIIFWGNKKDSRYRKIEASEVEKWCKIREIPFREVSAKAEQKYELIKNLVTDLDDHIVIL